MMTNGTRAPRFAPLGFILLLIPLRSAFAQPEIPECPIGNPCSGGITCCGQWTGCSAPLQPIHASLVHFSPGDSSNVLVWGYNIGGIADYAPARLWKLATDQLTCGAWSNAIDWPTHNSPNLFPPDRQCLGNIKRFAPMCGGHDFGKDGRLQIVSGIEDTLDSIDRNSYHTLWFNPATKSFAPVDSNLTRQRWYPSVRIRPGDPGVNSNAEKLYAWNGLQDGPNDNPTCYSSPFPSQYPDRLDGNDWTALTNGGAACHPILNGYAPVVFVPDSTWSGTGAGHWLAVSQVDNPATQMPDTWTSDPENCTTTTFSDAPRQHRNGPDVLGTFELNGDGTYKAGPNLYLIGGYSATVDSIPGCGSHAPHGDVSYFSASSKSWSSKASMSIPRQNHNAVLLPDNTILVVGGSKMLDCCQNDPTGSCGSNYEVPTPGGGGPARECITRIPEIYDVDANSWKQLASHSSPRTYHSAAQLLPDGRVYLGGGEYFKGTVPPYGRCPPTPTEHMLSIEVFKPPYMFRPSRPTIAALAADSAAYNTQLEFTVTGWEPNDSKVMLVRQGSATHGHEMAARIVHLQLTYQQLKSGSTYDLKARIPSASTGLLPAGWYMLWVVTNWSESNNRKPCQQARWVRLYSSGSGFAPEGETPMARSAPEMAPVEPPLEFAVAKTGTAVELLVTAASRSTVTIELYEVTGRHIRTLTAEITPGNNRLAWDGRSDAGRLMPAGIYLLRATGASGETFVEKVFLVR
jgi:Domain of unknown function (DUF1929)/FlgD Ig-like domain